VKVAAIMSGNLDRMSGCIQIFEGSEKHLSSAVLLNSAELSSPTRESSGANALPPGLNFALWSAAGEKCPPRLS